MKTKKPFLFLVVLLFLFSIKPKLPAQNVTIETTSLQIVDKRLEIKYDFSKDKTTNRFDVSVEIINAKGQKINARNLSGDIGPNQKGGKDKKIIWDYNADGLVLDEDIEVFVKAEMNTVEGAVNTGGCVARSLLVPGLGLSKIEKNKPYWLLGVLGYASLGGSLYFRSSYHKNYDNYLASTEQQESADYLQKSQNQKELSNVLMYTAIGTWSVSFIWTLLKSKQHNKSLASGKPNFRFDFYTRIDPVGKKPLFVVHYKF